MTELSLKADFDFTLTHAWPLGIVQEDGKNVGFAMDLFDLGFFRSVDHYYDNILRKEISDTRLLALPNLVLIAKNLCIELDRFHKKNIFLIDIKPQNIVVNTTTNEVVLLDCDGFAIEKDTVFYPANLISMDYIAPEVTAKKLRPENLGIAQDLYALSVLIFQILNRGLHPYSGKFKFDVNVTTNDDKAALGFYAYGVSTRVEIAPHVSSLHKMWPDRILTNLEAGFVSGKRANAAEWLAIFDSIEREKGFVRCENFPQNSQHIKFRDKECMQCRLDNLQITHAPKAPDKPKKYPLPPPIPSVPPPPKGISNSNGWIVVVILGFLALITLVNRNDSDANSSRVSNNDTAWTKCSDNPKKCDQSELCKKATTIKNGKRVWTTNNRYLRHVFEAKARESQRAGALYCNVKSKRSAKSEPPSTYVHHLNKSIIGYDILPNGIRNVGYSECLQRCAGKSACKAVSYIVRDRSCWLKPQTYPLTLRAGVKTAIKK